jgi:serine/threonine-protein kinase
MGAVYYAEDLRLSNRPVAVKENFDTSPEAATQFRIEAELLATLRHPNLPQVFDYFIEPKTGKQYLVMDYIAGEDLEDIVEKRGPLDERNALKIMLQVFDAVDYLHRQNPPVIHRDIKPSNIKVQPDGTAILVDFGIAKRYLPGRETIGAAAAVTPGYSPPEQYGQGITDQRSDIYALGATLYFALTGQVPPEAIERVTHGDKLVPPSRFNPRISPHVEQAILKAMSIRPIDRFISVVDFKRALMTPSVSRPAPTYRHTPTQQPTPRPSPYRRQRRPQPTPSNYNLEITMAGCVTTFAELMLWFAILWAIFGGCRGCLFVGFVFLLVTLTGWKIAGWVGFALATASLLTLWHLAASLARRLNWC